MVLCGLHGAAGAGELGKHLSTTHRVETPLSPTKRELQAPGVLVVAGPSGAGKSTFIDLLTKGQLPPEVRAELPHGSERWPHIEANVCLKHGVSLEAALPDGLGKRGIVLHYDIAFIYRYGIDYDKDPAWALLAVADCPVIACLKPPSDRLIRQFTARRQHHLSSKGPASRLWAQYARRPIRHAMARLRGQPVLETVALYNDHDWLRRCYQRWDAFVRTVVHDKPRSKVLQIEPCHDGASNPSFRLMGAPATLAGAVDL